jgi:hypothetical protein
MKAAVAVEVASCEVVEVRVVVKWLPEIQRLRSVNQSEG